MTPSEKVMQYVNRVINVQNKLTAVGHAVTPAERKCVMLPRIRTEFAVITGLIRATGKTIQESIGLVRIDITLGADSTGCADGVTCNQNL